MRNYISCVLMFCGLASAQAPIQRQPFPTDNRPLTGEEWRLKLVAHLMSLPSPVTNGAVQLYGMGDEAAVDVLKILSAKPSLTYEEMQATLDIVHMSFEHPESIISAINQKPRAASFLLQYLASTNGAPTARITNETKFLQAVKVPSGTNLVTPQP